MGRNKTFKLQKNCKLFDTCVSGGNEMLSLLIGKRLTDIYIIGFIYLEKGENDFIPDLRWMYFEFEDVLVEFESFDQYSRLKVERVSNVRYQFEYDEDMIKVKSSVKDLVLVSSILAGNIVKNIEIIDGTERNCAAVKIVLETEQIIFIDPSFPYGIGVGGQKQEEYWYYANK